MKKFIYLFINLSLFVTCSLYAQTSPGGGGAVGPSTINRPPLGSPPEKLGPKSSSQPAPAKVVTPSAPPSKPQFSYRPIFTQPGILRLGSGGFVGVDHLYNVSADIPVVVEIVKSESLVLSISKEKLQLVIERAFEREGITPTPKRSSGPSLPFFHLLIMVIPAGNGISAFCGGRLFEKVEIGRVVLPEDVYFQAITWEYQNLIFSSKEEGEKQIETAAIEIVEQFLSRYTYYKNIKN